MGSTVLAAVTAAIGVWAGPAAPAQAAPVPVFPGMEIHLGTNLCTLGFVDVQSHVAYTAGHCRSNNPVTDRANAFIGDIVSFRDNTPSGAVVSAGDAVFDYATIRLAPDTMDNNVLPGGRVLVSDPAVVPVVGEPVCHSGVATGESCGRVESVHNGWFTMSGGVVSNKGDSGGPVYTVTPDNRAVVVGLFNSTWGSLPAAVTWSAVRDQVAADVHISTSGQPT